MMTQRGAAPEGGRDEAEGDVEVDEDEVSALQERRIEDPLYCLNMKNRMHRYVWFSFFIRNGSILGNAYLSILN